LNPQSLDRRSKLLPTELSWPPRCSEATLVNWSEGLAKGLTKKETPWALGTSNQYIAIANQYIAIANQYIAIANQYIAIANQYIAIANQYIAIWCFY